MNQKVLAYLQLFRAPNVFTAIADIAMGFLFTVGMVKPQMFMLAFASASLYSAGMVLNDVMDFDVDKVERPERPLPSGRVEIAWAKKLGFGLLGLGVATALGVGPICGAVALALTVVIYLYDGPMKKTALAPWLMGSCRALNVLLGMSMAATFGQPDQLLIAGGLGLYVAGITWFARCEAKGSDAKLLQFGIAVMAVGIILLGLFPWFSDRAILLRGKLMWPTLLALLMMSVVRRCFFAIANNEPKNIQAAVKHSLFSLIVLDAAVVLAVCGPMYAIGVVALLVPTIFLGKWVYST